MAIIKFDFFQGNIYEAPCCRHCFECSYCGFRADETYEAYYLPSNRSESDEESFCDKECMENWTYKLENGIPHAIENERDLILELYED